MSFIINPYRFSGLNSLNTSLIAYWKLNEASGTRFDSVGSNDLADRNTVTSAAGKVGNAAEFVAANVEDLNIADNADLSMGDNVSYTIAGWFRITSTAVTQQIITKRTGGNDGTLKEYMLRLDNGDPTLYWANSVDTSFDKLSWGVTLSTATWYFFVFGYDATADQFFVNINNATAVTKADSIGSWNQLNPFQIGGANDDANFDGLIDEVGVWKRVLTSGEQTELYNSGNGITHPF